MNGMPPRKIDTSRRSTIAALLVVNTVGLFLVARFLHGGLNEWGGDNVDFLLLARALAGGEGYVNLHLPGHPPHTLYPPLFPVLLASLAWVDASLVACKWLVALCSLCGLSLALVLLARAYGPLRATLACLATLCSAVFLDPALSVMSDGLYLLVSMAALLACTRALRPGSGLGATALAGVLAGMLVGASILTRTVGITLLFALAFPAVLGLPGLRRLDGLRRIAVIGGIAAVLTAPWFHHAATAGGQEQGYVAQLLGAPEKAPPRPAAERTPVDSPQTGSPADKPLASGGEYVATSHSGAAQTLLGRPAHNARDLWLRLYYLRAPPWFEARGLALPFRITILTIVLAHAAVCAIGLLRSLLARRAMQDAYVAAYVVILVFWVGGGPRLLMPVLPFLILYVVDGAGWIASLFRQGREQSPKLELVLLSFALVLSFGVTTFSPRLNGRLTGNYPDWWVGLQEASRFLGQKKKPGLLVFTHPASVPYYVAGIQSVSSRPGAETLDRLLRQIIDSRADFVILTRPLNDHAERKLARVLKKYAAEFQQVRVFHGVRVYRVLRD